MQTTSPPLRPNLAFRAARFSARHRKSVIAGWLVFVLACVYLGGQLGTRELTPVESGDGSSGRAAALLHGAHLQERAVEAVVLQGRSRSSVHTAASALTERLRADADVASVSSRRTRDSGREALVEVSLGGDPEKAQAHVAGVQRAVGAVAREHPGVRLDESGAGSVERAIERAMGDSFRRAELSAVPITLVILGLVFGALVAALVPVLVGLTSVVAALGLEQIVSQVVPAFQTTPSAILLVGLAVGVDYCLFYLRREREERRAGRSPEDSLLAAASNVGHAVMVSGGIVLLAVGGLMLAGDAGFVSVGLGAMLVVAVAVLGSVSVLPALLALLGDRVQRGRLPRLGRHRPVAGGNRAWRALARAVVGRPRRSLALVGLLLIALAAPIAQLHLTNNGVDDLPASSAAVRSEHAVEKAFPGAPETADVVVQGAGVGTVSGAHRLRALGAAAMRQIGVQGAPAIRTARDGRTAAISLPLPGDGDDPRTLEALGTLEHRTLPALARAFPGAQVQLGGEPAGGRDFSTIMRRRAPLVIGVTLLVGFLLLLLAFRSVALAAVVLALNCLSVAGAGGAMVLIFQHDWAQRLLGFTSNGAIASWLPMFAFVVLFGLSMDYTVLVVSRIRELARAGLSGREAAVEGVASTAGTVTGAAIVMIAVFAVFGTLQVLELKELGVGLAVAVLLDATVVRGIALPAAVSLLAERAWGGERRGQVSRERRVPPSRVRPSGEQAL